MVDDFHSRSETFMSWLHNSSATICNKIALRDLRQKDAGRGVVATSDIEEDELLFSIPRTSVLSVENSNVSKTVPSLFTDLDPWLSLILVMIYEYLQGPRSIWKPYFDILPTEFDTCMFWSEEELAELQASAVRSKIGKEGADKTFEEILVPLIRQHAASVLPEELRENVSNADLVNLAHRMGSTIMAYAFDIEPVKVAKEVDEDGYVSEDEEEALPKAMVPLADMLNADADLNNARLFYEDEALTMKALKPIKAGEEILNDYGPLPRSDLLRRYGYITDNYEKYDVVEVAIDLVCDIIQKDGRYTECAIDTRLDYLDEMGIISLGYDISAPIAPPDTVHMLSPELVILVETLTLSGDQFARYKKSNKLPKANLSPSCAELLCQVLRARAAQYPTTVEADFVQISHFRTEGSRAQSVSERRKRMAMKVRHGEKKILDNAMSALNAIVWQTPTNQSEKRTDESMDTGSNKRRKI